MKTRLAWLLSPVSVATCIGHWIAVVYAMYGENHPHPFHFYYEPVLTKALVLLNFPCLLVSATVFGAASAIGGDNPFTNFIGGSFAFLAISFQWLLIGSGVNAVVQANAKARDENTTSIQL